MFSLLSLFEVVISKAIEQLCLCSEEHGAKIMHFPETAKQFANYLQERAETSSPKQRKRRCSIVSGVAWCIIKPKSVIRTT